MGPQLEVDADRPLTADEREIVDLVNEVLTSHQLVGLDETRSTASADENGLHIALRHRNGDHVIDIDADGEIVVSYGLEHEHFRQDDYDGSPPLPFVDADHRTTAVAFVEQLLTGRIALDVWRRPLAIKTRSYWVDDDGAEHLFMRGGTIGPFWGWSKTPERHVIDFTTET